MNNIEIPVLYCPFPSAINQHFETVNQHSFDWIRSFNLIPDESVYQRFRAFQLPLSAALVAPNASLEALKIISDFFLWGFIVDDQFERAGISKQPEILESMHARFVDILNGASLTDSDTPFGFALRDSCQRLHQQLHWTSELMLRFIKNMEDYFQAVRWEATTNSQKIKLNVATYIKQREFTIGVRPFLDLMFIAERIALPTKVIEHPMMERLHQLTCNIVAWTNDIFSVEKDISQQVQNNLLFSLQNEYQLSLQKALERATEMLNAEVVSFIELSAQLPSFGNEIDTNLQGYLSSLRSWIRGNLDFYLESPRYHLTKTTSATSC